ncbi:BZ3500_MvSof-1268-A1-R1_Chr2-3g05316 [Microbotryum saponariae]|uniref:BZ3500_MvSof-1268-A1-R1_Chr2-3g05316 protein n=1 Tax=Microbotryum saponariae TaxID=289078 RepID=A0A2X0L3P5_9BASI|nr:BZ3500_MvSof-1268-A1-R1_Chr2-3g05316 [Microbotryum saponariae]SDA01184.1 BZ3501_MvSof-1269-A2-R1_Chr2-2g04989 [Microbotryum saponariae]
MTPVIDVYVTSILSSAQLRTKHDRVQRILVSARVPFSTHDVASSEEAKLEWKRRNRNNNELPCIIVDGQPVGTIEQLDEAVEFGELRQFLRLDEHTSSTTTETTPPPPPPSSEKPSSLKATVDDFASLSLTETELAQLSQELSSNQTLSLPEAEPPSLTSRSSHGFATQVHDVMPLNLHRSDKDAEGNRIEYRRVGDHQRPLRIDASQDLSVLDGVEEDELEKLARELEMEEEEEQRVQRVGGKVEAPSPPPKDEVPLSLQVEKETPPTPKEEIRNPTENSEPSTSTSTNFVPVDSVGGDGGAGLSKPLEQVQELDLSSDQVDELLSTQDTEKKEIEVLQPTEFEKSAIEATKLEKQHGSVQEGEDLNGTVGEEEKSEPKSSKDEVDKLKKDLKEGGTGGLNRVVELELGVPKEVAAQGETVRSDEVEISM